HLAARNVAPQRLPVGADLARRRAKVHDLDLRNSALERIAGDGAPDDGEEVPETAGGGEPELGAGEAVPDPRVVVEHGRVDPQAGERRQLALAAEQVPLASLRDLARAGAQDVLDHADPASGGAAELRHRVAGAELQHPDAGDAEAVPRELDRSTAA